MKIEIFKLPIWIGNIDCEKIDLESNDMKRTWYSETLSSLNTDNKISQKSMNYILNIIYNLTKKEYGYYQYGLLNIWSNSYAENDYQEPHIHAGSHLSFIIYKKVNEAKTVFNHPCQNIIEAFQMSNFFDTIFEPKCRENQIVVFPSFMEHWVKKNSDSFTIAGNVKLIEKEKNDIRS